MTTRRPSRRVLVSLVVFVSLVVGLLLTGSALASGKSSFSWLNSVAQSVGLAAMAPEPAVQAKNRIKAPTLGILASVMAPRPQILGPTAATYTWNVAGDGLFNTATNWTPNRTAPAVDDIIVFNNGATINASNVATQTIGQLSIGGGTKVTFQAAVTGQTLTIGGGLGALSLANGSQLNVSGTNVLTITVATGSTATISGAMTFSSTAVTAHRFVGTDASSITVNSGGSITQGQNVTGNLFTGGSATAALFTNGSVFDQIASSSATGGSNPFANAVFQPTSLYKYEIVGGTPSFSGRTYGNFEYNAAGGATVTGGTAMSIGNITIDQATFNYNMTGVTGHTINGNISVVSGAVLNFAPATAATVSIKGNIAFAGNVTFNPAVASTYNLNGTSTQTVSGVGNFGTNANTTISISNTAGVTLQRNFDNTVGPVTVASGGFLDTGASLVQGTGTFTLASGGTLGIGSTAGITASSASGNIQTTTRSFSPGGNYTYNGAANQVVGDGLPASVANLTIVNSGGAGSNTVTGNAGQTVTGLLHVQSGTYSAASTYNNVQIDNGATYSATSSSTVNVAGNWTNQGTFNANGDTVNFNGGTGQTVTGSTSFFNFTKSVGAAQQMNFAANSITEVTNALTLNGAAGQLLALRSTTPGIKWKLVAPATQSINFVDVKDSDASLGTTANATNSVNSGNNVNWAFTAPEIDIEAPVGTPRANNSTVDFGRAAVNVNGALITFKVINSGTATLTGIALSKDGTDASQFFVNGTLPTSLAPGANASVDIRFAPTSAGNKTAAIHVTSNDADENPYNINLTGVAVVPTMNVPTTTLNFGSVAIGEVSAEQSYSVSATDLVADMQINAPTDFKLSLTTGTGFSPNLTISPDVNGTIPATTIFVRYQPTTVGNNSSGNISHSTSGGGFVFKPVTGTGFIPTVLTVNTTVDANDGFCTSAPGGCTLREAILAANTINDTNTIQFAIPGSGVQTITPNPALPTITQPVIIDGYSQSGASANALAAGDNANILIELNGTNSGGTGLTITAGSSTVKGLVMNRFSGTAIVLTTAGGNTISGNFIGTDPTGTTWSTLGSGFLTGISVQATGNTVGGTTPASRNIIVGGSSFATGDGIDLSSGASGNFVQGNYIGTDKNGSAKVGNTGIGVFLDGGSGSNNLIGGTTGTTPGGSCTGACNLLSGTGEGFQSNGPGSNTTIQGNFVGTNASGTAAIPDQSDGVRFSFLSSGTGHLIGGTTASARNIISGNVGNGIQIQTGPSVTIQGNYVGVQTDGTSALGNGIPTGDDGIELVNNATVGGTAAGAGNIVANNNGIGIRVGGTGNSIRGNSIYNNLGLGIDLEPLGVTANDNLDGDTGSNNLQNFPIITSGVIGTTTVGGTLNSTPGQSFAVDVYSNDSCDSSGNGEGKTYLGSATTGTTDGSGNTTFSTTVPSIVAGKPLTATATDAGGNTSEFSACFTPTPPPPTVLVSTNGPLAFGNVTVGNTSPTQTYTVSGSNLTANLVVTAPADFQVSTSPNSGFGATVTLTPSGGTVNTTTIFVRYVPTSAGPNNSGSISNASTGATTQNVGVTGTGIAATCATAPSGMVAWYRAESNALDTRGGTNGVFEGTAAYTSGKVGQAFNLNGTDADVKAPASPSINVGTGANGFSIDTWINPTSVASQQPIVEWNDGTGNGSGTGPLGFGSHLWLSAGSGGAVTPGSLYMNFVDTSGGGHVVFTPAGVVSAGSWQHVAVTYDRNSGLVNIYVNGVAQSLNNSNIGNVPSQTSYDMYLGYRKSSVFPGDAGQRFVGGIDEVELFNRPLLSSEIGNIYNASTAGKCTDVGAGSGLVAWWAGDGDARDITGNGNNGTLQNGAGFVAGKVGQAFNLNGITQQILIGNPADLQLQDFTIDAWVQRSSASVTSLNPAGPFQLAAFYSYDTNGYGFGILTDGRLLLTKVGVDGVNSTALTVTDTNFHHVSVTKSGSTVIFYVDGVSETAPAYNQTFSFTSNAFIGEFGGGAGQFFGTLDEVDIFNRALSGNEIQSIFNAGIAGKYKSVATPTGANVSSNAGGDATVTFANVSAGGTTQQVPLDPTTLPSLPASHTSLGLYYDISTAASYTGPTTVCFHLPLVTSAGTFSNIRIDHLENGNWVNRSNAGSTNFGTQTVCTVGLPSLSPFAIVTVNPTAAGVSISGRVLTPDGAGLRNARVVMTDQNGVMRTALTNAFGAYTFDNITSGGSYLIGVQSRKYTYATRVVLALDTLTDVDFSPQ